jgi:hypothetical protein
LEFMGNVSECSKDQSFEEVTNKTTLAIVRADILQYCLLIPLTQLTYLLTWIGPDQKFTIFSTSWSSIPTWEWC